MMSSFSYEPRRHHRTDEGGRRVADRCPVNSVLPVTVALSSGGSRSYRSKKRHSSSG